VLEEVFGRSDRYGASRPSAALIEETRRRLVRERYEREHPEPVRPPEVAPAAEPTDEAASSATRRPPRRIRVARIRELVAEAQRCDAEQEDLERQKGELSLRSYDLMNEVGELALRELPDRFGREELATLANETGMQIDSLEWWVKNTSWERGRPS
jgi:hypothetical protein